MSEFFYILFGLGAFFMVMIGFGQIMDSISNAAYKRDLEEQEERIRARYRTPVVATKCSGSGCGAKSAANHDCNHCGQMVVS